MAPHPRPLQDDDLRGLGQEPHGLGLGLTSAQRCLHACSRARTPVGLSHLGIERPFVCFWEEPSAR